MPPGIVSWEFFDAGARDHGHFPSCPLHVDEERAVLATADLDISIPPDFAKDFAADKRIVNRQIAELEIDSLDPATAAVPCFCLGPVWSELEQHFVWFIVHSSRGDTDLGSVVQNRYHALDSLPHG